MDCKVCAHEMMVLDMADHNKPLRCSDTCPENRKSLLERNPVKAVAVVEEGLTTAKRKRRIF